MAYGHAKVSAWPNISLDEVPDHRKSQHVKSNYVQAKMLHIKRLSKSYSLSLRARRDTSGTGSKPVATYNAGMMFVFR